MSEAKVEPGPDAAVSLREITSKTLRDICKLSDSLTPPKSNFVASNVYSIAEAHFAEHAWFRAIYADEEPVGFLMLSDKPEIPEYFLWRLMIAQPHHGRGYGRRAIELLVEHVKTRPGATELLVSCGQGEGSPEGFYQRLGFEHNGEMYGREIGLILKF